MKFSSRIFLILIAFALLLPQFLASPRQDGIGNIGLPRVYSGDEPHYLLILNSMLLDGDWDLRNNHLSAHQGSSQAGEIFTWEPLDHHTTWYHDGKRMTWRDSYVWDGRLWNRDEMGFRFPRAKEGKQIPADHLEYSTHPPSQTLLLAPLLYPFRTTDYIEPIAIFFSWIVTVIGMVWFWKLARLYTNREWIVNLLTAAVFLGSPAWNYSRSFFSEPYLLTFAIGAYYYGLQGRRTWLSGLLIGLGCLTKPPFILLAIPLGLKFLLEKKFRKLLWFSIPIVACGCAYLALNAQQFGGVTRASQKLPFTRRKTEIFADKLIAPAYGLLPYVPYLLFAFYGWIRFWKTNWKDAACLITGAVFYSAIFMFLVPGGACYGPRYLLPTVPLLALGLIPILENIRQRSGITKMTLAFLLVVSFWINLLGAFPYWKWWRIHPFQSWFVNESVSLVPDTLISQLEGNAAITDIDVPFFQKRWYLSKKREPHTAFPDGIDSMLYPTDLALRSELELFPDDYYLYWTTLAENAGLHQKGKQKGYVLWTKEGDSPAASRLDREIFAESLRSEVPLKQDEEGRYYRVSEPKHQTVFYGPYTLLVPAQQTEVELITRGATPDLHASMELVKEGNTLLQQSIPIQGGKFVFSKESVVEPGEYEIRVRFTPKPGAPEVRFYGYRMQSKDELLEQPDTFYIRVKPGHNFMPGYIGEGSYSILYSPGKISPSTTQENASRVSVDNNALHLKKGRGYASFLMDEFPKSWDVLILRRSKNE